MGSTRTVSVPQSQAPSPQIHVPVLVLGMASHQLRALGNLNWGDNMTYLAVVSTVKVVICPLSAQYGGIGVVVLQLTPETRGQISSLLFEIGCGSSLSNTQQNFSQMLSSL